MNTWWKTKTYILSQKEIKINSCHGWLCIEITLMLLAFAHWWQLCESLKAKAETVLILRGIVEWSCFKKEKSKKQNKTKKGRSVIFQLLTVPMELQRVLQELKKKLVAQSSGVSGNWTGASVLETALYKENICCSVVFVMLPMVSGEDSCHP